MPKRPSSGQGWPVDGPRLGREAQGTVQSPCDWTAQTPGNVLLVTFLASRKVTRRRRKTSLRRSGGFGTRASARRPVSDAGGEARSFAALRMTRGEVGAGPPLDAHCCATLLGTFGTAHPLARALGANGVWCFSCKKHPSPQPSPPRGEGDDVVALMRPPRPPPGRGSCAARGDTP